MDIDAMFSCFQVVDANANKQYETVAKVPSTQIVQADTIKNLEENNKRPHEGNEPAEDDIKRVKPNNDFSIMETDLNLDELYPVAVTHTIETNESCIHEVVVPPGSEYIPLAPMTSEPAKKYSFTLDSFQNEAIQCIDNLQSVLVSAHTSAGKTVVAEYAIALALKSKQRVIYTTPIKALSNQKYREFSQEFNDVGLMTGDVTINPSASCLIMTTEILRNMLYRSSDITREVGWVVFDEIHYMRDKMRGVVWEETLILLPDTVRYVFLSATIPNARQFAEWVCRLHAQPCHVVYTEYRPTPLQHYVFPAGGDGIHLVVDEKGQFKEDNFKLAMSVLSKGDAAKGDVRGRRGGPRDGKDTNIYSVVKMIMEKHFSPVIIFSFSKKDCETYAVEMARLDFNTAENKKMVDEIFNNAMDVLSEEDRKLPQVESMIPLLRRGIGIHHGGLLPILKETIEILFGVGLIKALFATETFAMGLNMPARTVVFTGCKKFDGKDFRYVTSGEYIQMSGRAGRRGLDDKGIVILMVDQKVTPAAIKDMVQGKADPLNSAFHITYNMILSLMRVEGINPQYMLEKSFYQFQQQAVMPELIEKLKTKEKACEGMSLDREAAVAEYCNTRAQLDALDTQFRAFITQPKYLIRFLQYGRLVKVKTEKHDYGWGYVLNFKQNKWQKAETLKVPPLTVKVFVHCKKDNPDDPEDPNDNVPCPIGEDGVLKLVSISHTDVARVSVVRANIHRDHSSRKNQADMIKILAESHKRFPDGLPLLDPIKDMKIDGPVFADCVQKMNILEERLKSHPLHNDENRDKLIAAYEKKQILCDELNMAKAELHKVRSIVYMDELKKRKRVLKRLGYCTASDVIELKGRIACELSSADELLLTELMFNGVFCALSAEQSAALVSCFVCDENSAQASASGEELRGVLRQLQEYARRIAKVSVDAKLELDEDEYVGKFKCTLMDVVLAWAKGASFLQICKMTDVFEGSVIRCMRRLEEVLRQLSQAAKNIGNTDLENKFSDAIKKVKRDIIFAASLYM